MNANQLIDALLQIEFSADTAPDERRIIRDERMRVQVALANLGKSDAHMYSANFPERAKEMQRQADIDTAESLRATMERARRVAKMWGHSL